MLMNIHNLGAMLQTNNKHHMFGLPIASYKLTMTINISCALVDIHFKKKHVANVGCTYVAKVFPLIASKTSSTNNFFDGKTTFMHNLYVAWCNQMDWTIIISKKLLFTCITLHLPRYNMCLMLFFELICKGERSTRNCMWLVTLATYWLPHTQVDF